MARLLALRAAVLSLLLLLVLLSVWQLAVSGAIKPVDADPEYAKLLGDSNPKNGATFMPGPISVGENFVEHLKQPFFDDGPNDKGFGVQLGYSILRVLIGYTLAMVIALPLGFLIGMSPLMNKALNPFIQLLKPISPLAWMPIALYVLKDSEKSAIFVIFICSIWPMLINTGFGVASVRKEWLNVARTLEVGTLRRAFTVILPAAAPTILTGMRISIGIAWLVIVAAEMLVGGTGIGYFVWNQWNKPSYPDMLSAILLIGIAGMLLDWMMAWATKLVTFPE